jgi:hypothetical protein
MLGLREKAVDFDALDRECVAAMQPSRDRQHAIKNEYNRWFQAELARGASVVTEPPAEVEAALAKERAKMVNAGRSCYMEHEASIVDAARGQVADVQAAYAALIEAMSRLEAFRDRWSQFARACGTPAPAQLVDPAITSYGFEEWRLRADRALNPPAPRPAARAADNPLRL